MSPLRILENPQNKRVNGVALAPGSVIPDDKFLPLDVYEKLFDLGRNPVNRLATNAGIIESGQTPLFPNGFVYGFTVGQIPKFIHSAQQANIEYSTNPDRRFYPWSETLDGKFIDTGNNFTLRTKNQILFEYTYSKRSR